MSLGDLAFAATKQVLSFTMPFAAISAAKKYIVDATDQDKLVQTVYGSVVMGAGLCYVGSSLMEKVKSDKYAWIQLGADVMFGSSMILSGFMYTTYAGYPLYKLLDPALKQSTAQAERGVVDKVVDWWYS